jgi:hemolysin activation/secretion protein
MARHEIVTGPPFRCHVVFLASRAYARRSSQQNFKLQNPKSKQTSKSKIQAIKAVQPAGFSPSKMRPDSLPIGNQRHSRLQTSATNALSGLSLSYRALLGLLAICLLCISSSQGAETNTAAAKDSPNFTVTGYEVRGVLPDSTNNFASLLSKYTGDVGLQQLVMAASALQMEYRNQGGSTVSVAIAQERITNGLVVMNVFRGEPPQVFISGKKYTNSFDVALASTPAKEKKADSPHFLVRAYEIRGDTLLTEATLTSILKKYTGTNIGIEEIGKARAELQMEYRNRGYPTVSVTVPQQQLTNGIVKIRVFQGWLSEIAVLGNRFFSSNNVRRSLPSLKEHTILNGTVFQAELDRANANQDRQIYPELSPGPSANTSDLTLKVKDRLPVHGKIELDNQNSPGTPELRINSSLVDNNLWQHEHSIGLQYSFSPELQKTADDWSWYDRPRIANYSTFYRMPLGNPQNIEDTIAAKPGGFGYDEATRKFRLPAASGKAELNVFASRSTIDTGVETVLSENLYNANGNSLDRRDVQQDLTTTSDVGTRLSLPLPGTDNFRSTFSGGLDYKYYKLISAKTNIFTLSSYVIDYTSDPSHPQTNINRSEVVSPVPTTEHVLDYLPLSVRYDGSLKDALGTTTFGLGLNGNAWYSGSKSNLQGISGSSDSSGYWVALTPSFSRDLLIHTNWVLTFRADGQWTSEPLISNEQFGLGGINSVRGYHEGEVFGDTGWRVSLEQKTPPHVIGLVGGTAPLTIRGSVYMDYGEAYLLDPNGRDRRTALWGTGFGAVASLGAHFEARFLFSWPLMRTSFTESGEPRFDFSLSAQF